ASVSPANKNRAVSTAASTERTGGNLFIFDEPTTGLHFDDVAMLLQLFQRLIDAGHSLVVIEHNLEVIKSADWIIDLGPEAGDDGGEIVAAGKPEQVAKIERSHTGRFLREILGSARASRAVRGASPRISVNAIPDEEHDFSLRVAEEPFGEASNEAREVRAGLAWRALPEKRVHVAANGAIQVHGAREHNLKNIDVAIPRDQMVVITGLSGSGK